MCRRGLLLLRKDLGDHDGIIVDAIDDAPGHPTIRDPEFVTAGPDARHGPRMRHSKELTRLELPEQEPLVAPMTSEGPRMSRRHVVAATVLTACRVQPSGLRRRLGLVKQRSECRGPSRFCRTHVCTACCLQRPRRLPCCMVIQGQPVGTHRLSDSQAMAAEALDDQLTLLVCSTSLQRRNRSAHKVRGCRTQTATRADPPGAASAQPHR